MQFNSEFDLRVRMMMHQPATMKWLVSLCAVLWQPYPSAHAELFNNLFGTSGKRPSLSDSSTCPFKAAGPFKSSGKASSRISPNLLERPEQVHLALGRDPIRELRVEWTTGVDENDHRDIDRDKFNDTLEPRDTDHPGLDIEPRNSDAIHSPRAPEHPPNWTSCSPRWRDCGQCVVYGSDKDAVDEYKGGCEQREYKGDMSFASGIGIESSSGIVASDVVGVGLAETYFFTPGTDRVTPVHVATMRNLPAGRKEVFYKVGDGIGGERSSTRWEMGLGVRDYCMMISRDE